MSVLFMLWWIAQKFVEVTIGVASSLARFSFAVWDILREGK